MGNVWLQPSPDHLLGTDQIGGDMFTRLLYVARNTIALGFVITILPFIVGIICDFTAATLKGWTDQTLSRMVDIMMAFPTLIFYPDDIVGGGHIHRGYDSRDRVAGLHAGVAPVAGGGHGH